MGPGMPYHLEKGAVPRLLETYLNTNRKKMRERVEKLRRTDPSDAWLVEGLFRHLDDSALKGTPSRSRFELYKHLMVDWFGYDPADDGWRRQDPGALSATGYWRDYRGDVGEIFRRAVLWSLELALGLGPNDVGAGRWWPYRIEIFWTCPSHWFEAWVVSRPIRLPLIRRNTITLLFMTPAYRGSEVAHDPRAHHPKVRVPDIPHPVPSWEDDYELLGGAHPEQRPPDDPRPRISAVDRRYAMWVVTHAGHDLLPHVDTTAPHAVGDLEPGGAGVYKGREGVVVVSPSLFAGGVLNDGSIPVKTGTGA